MPKISGRVVNNQNVGVAGVVAQLVQYAVFGRTIIDSGTTDASGNFAINVSSQALAPGQFIVKLRSAVYRLMAETAPFSIFASDITLPTVAIHANTLTGWLITNRDASGRQLLLSQNNAVTFLIDDERAWKELSNSIKRAKNELNFQTLIQEIGKVFMVFNPDPVVEGVKTTGERLENLLIDASVVPPTPPKVRYVIWDAVTTVSGAPFDTAQEVATFFVDPTTEPNNVKVRRFETNFSTPMHAKFVTIDAAEAHIIGSPIIQQYFDSTQHSISEPRRGKLSGRYGIQMPIHDVTIKLVGPVVQDLRQTFFLHWNNVAGAPAEPVPVLPTPPPSGSNVSIQLARTLPGDNRFREIPEGETGMLEAYLRAFFEATDYVYLESQYLLSEDIFEGIRLALRRTPSLQFIIVINYSPDLPFYARTQSARVRQLLANADTDGTRNRIGVFTLWLHELGITRNKLLGLYVHAKTAVVDDKWAVAGTSNLDGTSMGMTDYFSTLDVPAVPTSIVRRVDEQHRSVEVNAVIFDGVAGQPANGLAAQLRRKLWGEHLGVAETDPQLSTRPVDGWLGLWRAKAAAKLAALNANPPQLLEQARPLPWNASNVNLTYLQNAGITNVGGRFEVLQSFPSFDFDTGRFI